MKQTIKIAIFHCGFIYSGGGERIVLEEAKGLKKRGYIVEVFAPTLDRKLCYPEDVKNLKVKTFLPQLPSFIPGRHAILMVLSSVLAPLFALRFLDIDIFVGENQPGAWIAYCVSKVLRKPYIVYMNQPNRLLYSRKIDREVKWQNLKEYYFIDNLIKRMKRFVSWADRVSFTSGRVILGNGNYIGKIIEKIYHCSTVACPAGAYVQSLNTKTQSHKGKLKVENLNGKIFEINRPYILLTNRHEPQKKFKYAIEAMEILLKKLPKVSLVIPGPFTEYTLDLLGLVKSSGISKNVLFPGQVSEETLQKLYQKACVYIYTAPEEDFGMGVIEAMAWGVPVVAWNNAGPTTTIISGKTGFLANPFDISDFAQKISTLLQDQKLRNRMGKSAWEQVKANFSWDKHVDIIDKVVKEVLN